MRSQKRWFGLAWCQNMMPDVPASQQASGSNCFSGSSSGRGCPDTDRGDEPEAGLMPFVFALTTPEAIFVKLASEVAAFVLHRTRGADRPRQSLSPFTCLGPLRCERKEQVRQTTASGLVHPTIVASLADRRKLHGCHHVPLAVRKWSRRIRNFPIVLNARSPTTSPHEISEVPNP